MFSRIKYTALLLVSLLFLVKIDAKAYSTEEIILISRVVQAEAGNQCFAGKRLVADTILNRIEKEGFPNTVKGVIYQEGQYSNPGKRDEECINAVILEIHTRFDHDIVWFRTTDYHKYGTPAYQVGNHFFSKVETNTKDASK